MPHTAYPQTPTADHTATFAGDGDAARPASAQALSHYQIIRRNGSVVHFEPNKIAVALMKAFLAVHGTQGAASASVRETVEALTQSVVKALMRSRPGGGTFHIEDVQDQVELGLMRGGHHEVARAYVLYRERRTQERARQAPQAVAATAGVLSPFFDSSVVTRARTVIEPRGPVLPTTSWTACAALTTSVSTTWLISPGLHATCGRSGSSSVTTSATSWTPCALAKVSSAARPSGCLRL